MADYIVQNEPELGQAIVDSDGDWEVTPLSPLTAATEYTVSATQRVGNTTSLPSTSVRFTTVTE